MLLIVLNRLKSKAEELLSTPPPSRPPPPPPIPPKNKNKKQNKTKNRASFQSTVEQIFNWSVLIEKHLQHQKDFFHKEQDQGQWTRNKEQGQGRRQR